MSFLFGGDGSRSDDLQNEIRTQFMRIDDSLKRLQGRLETIEHEIQTLVECLQCAKRKNNRALINSYSRKYDNANKKRREFIKAEKRLEHAKEVLRQRYRLDRDATNTTESVRNMGRLNSAHSISKMRAVGAVAQRETIRMHAIADVTRDSVAIINESAKEMAEEDDEFYCDDDAEDGDSQMYPSAADILKETDDIMAIDHMASKGMPILVPRGQPVHNNGGTAPPPSGGMGLVDRSYQLPS